MKFEEMIPQLLLKAKEAGIEEAEAYYVLGDHFSASSMNEEIIQYAVSTTYGLSFRGLYQGKMGYASTQAMDDDTIGQLIEGVKESAQLIESEEKESIFPGEKEYPQVNTFEPNLEEVSEEEKLAILLQMEKAAKAVDRAIEQVADNTVLTNSSQVGIANSFGLNISFKQNMAGGYTAPVAKRDGQVAMGMDMGFGKDFVQINLPQKGVEAANRALNQLGNRPVPSGKYFIVFSNEAMSSLLATFSGSFSAENAQQGLSLLAGKEGEQIGADKLTITDDPLLPYGISSRPFDDEGVACKSKNLVEKGILNTLLHNRKTSEKAGVQSTGNGLKAGYTAPIKVGPTNLFIAPGTKSLQLLMEQAQDAIVITDLEGLHSGANEISGDFSLSAKGYRVEKGARTFPISQITIAGNFFALLKDVIEVGNDLWFSYTGIGSPSVYVNKMSIAGL